MAQRALTVEWTRPSAAPVVHFPGSSQPPPEATLERLKKVAIETYRVIQDRAARIDSVFFDKSSTFGSRFKRQIQTTREERPLRILGVAAGTAFALGIVLRGWSTRHE